MKTKTLIISGKALELFESIKDNDKAVHTYLLSLLHMEGLKKAKEIEAYAVQSLESGESARKAITIKYS